MGGAARFVRTLIPRGRYLPFGSCPCRSRGFDTWRPPAVQGHGGFATPTAEAAPPILLLPIPASEPRPSTAEGYSRCSVIPSPASGGGLGWGLAAFTLGRLKDRDREHSFVRRCGWAFGTGGDQAPSLGP